MRFPFWQSLRQGSLSKTPPASSSAANAKLEELRRRFDLRLREDYAILSQHRGCQLAPSAELKSIVHRLAGSAGMLGFHEISDVAGRLDDAFETPGSDTATLFLALLDLLERTLNVPRTGTTST
ncbi:MAG TPA: Hpt domain-containing protein [Rhizomicrobium sp.]